MANERARGLRKIMTPHEVRLWLRLRALRPQNLHFRRQVPLEGFVVDFACLKARLVIEVDGEQHGLPVGLVRDRHRDVVLGGAGFHVIRFWNHDIVNGIDDVVETIYRLAVERMTSSAVCDRRL